MTHPPYQNLHIYFLSGRLPYYGKPGPTYLGNWQEENNSFLFFTSPARAEVENLIVRFPHLYIEGEYEMTYEEWQGTHIGPLTIGGFQLIPPWNHTGATSAGNPVRDRHYKNIIFNPGVVFGNGLHPTTRDCLCLLESAWDVAPIHTVLDLGCGTGILSLAAARLGADRVVAVDNNHLATQTTYTNVTQNDLEQKVLVVQGDAVFFINQQADLLIANLHFAVLRQLISSPGFIMKPWSILSGLLTSEAEIIAESIGKKGASIEETHVSEGKWHTFLVTSPDREKLNKTG